MRCENCHMGEVFDGKCPICGYCQGCSIEGCNLE